MTPQQIFSDLIKNPEFVVDQVYFVRLMEYLAYRIPMPPKANRCPLCKRALRKPYREKGYNGRVRSYSGDQFCPSCGQAIKWEGGRSMTLAEKEKQAIERLKIFKPTEREDPYYLAYSGGKDSDVILALAKLSGVEFEAHHNLTTADAPETVYYVRSQPEVIIDRPRISMWELIPKKLMPPTRLVRYCCAELKERGGQGRRVITGIRWAESANRKNNSDLVMIQGKPKTTQNMANEKGVKYRLSKSDTLMLNNDNAESRDLIDHCAMQGKIVVNPIIDWTDDDVWEFLRHYGIESNPLYQCGFSRVGCIGCPVASAARYFEFNRYPKYKANYIRAFQKIVERRKEKGLHSFGGWTSGEQIFKWWMNEDPTQLTFDDIEGTEWEYQVEKVRE